MATTRRYMPVPPEAVWEVLADPAGYEYWVVGSREVRDADAGFPAAGTRFQHTLGLGPLSLSDHTEVLEADAPATLRLRAHGRPLSSAMVTIRLEPADGGTTVEMAERPAGRYAVLGLNPLVHALIALRNARSLMRLEDLARRRSGA